MAEKYMKTIQFENNGDIYHPLPLLDSVGKTWTQSNGTIAEADDEFNSVYYGNNTWVAASINGLYYNIYSYSGKASYSFLSISVYMPLLLVLKMD